MTAEIVCPHCGQRHRANARFCPTTGLTIPTKPEGGGGHTGYLSPNAMLNNRYLIVRKVGQGGMAAVYQVTDIHQPGVVWAVKEMSDSAITDPNDRPQAIQLFQQEAQLLRSLSHPNMPKVVDVFTDGGKHYVVMEYIEGSPLDKLLEKRGTPFAEADILPWATQLCDVLGYLHSRNIIFRDLKPGNIMLARNGQIKLIDFGIVRFFKPGKARDTQALGTPGFAAPEALTGQTDARSDIYSLCVTLHQLLTLHDPETTMFSVPPARQLNPAVSTAMESILKRGMENERTRRWPGMNELRLEFSKLTPKVGPAIQPPLYGSGPFGSTGAARTSRPTTRLIMAASQLSTGQLLAMGGGLTLAIVIATWVLAPLLSSIAMDWNVIPLTALFGAFGYAARPRRGSAFLSHTVLSAAMTLTINARLGWPSLYTGTDLFWSILVSGVIMEIWVAFIGRVKAGAGDAWKREAAWLAGMAVVGTVVMFGLLFDWLYLFNILQWIVAALLGTGGWFVGDLIQQALLFRRTGFRRPPG